MSRKIRTLLFSTLYPSSVRPGHGIFVETRLRELLKTGEVETRVVAPVPWFPFSGARFGEYGKLAATPRVEQRNGVDVSHPRYALPPKVGMNIAPYSLARGALPTIERIIREGFDFDVIDAHYYYPDGVAAGLIAKKLGKPFVVTARGTDLNVFPLFPRPRRLILETAERAYASIGVCQALMDALAGLGADQNKLRVLRNGVDLDRFKPEERSEARARLQLPPGRIILSVGHLVELKGHDVAIAALKLLPPDCSLVVAGSGPEFQKLQNLATQLGLIERVRFAGQLDNSELRWWYSAADVLVLCSSREGWPNVLLEAMACGTPVIATDVGGTREIIGDPVAGFLLKERSPHALAAACTQRFAEASDRVAVRRYAEKFGWDATSNAQVELFSELVN